MSLPLQIDLPTVVAILNQLFQLEAKLSRRDDADSLFRHIGRIRELIADAGLAYENPLGQRYCETRTDCDATLVGPATGDLRIVEVIKPVVLWRQSDDELVVQRAVVIVACTSKQETV